MVDDPQPSGAPDPEPLAGAPPCGEDDPDDGAPLIAPSNDIDAEDSNLPMPTLDEAIQSIPESTRNLLEKRLRGRFISVSRLPRNALIK